MATTHKICIHFLAENAGTSFVLMNSCDSLFTVDPQGVTKVFEDINVETRDLSQYKHFLPQVWGMMTLSNEFFFTNWPFVRGIHQSLVVLPPKGQWYGAFMFSLIFAWTNSWANNWHTGDFRCHLSHYDVSVMDSHVEMCTAKTNYWALWKYCEIPNHIMLLVSLPSPWVDHLRGFSTAFDTKVYIGFSIIGQFTGLHGSRPFLVINQVVFEPIQLYIYIYIWQCCRTCGNKSYKCPIRDYLGI